MSAVLRISQTHYPVRALGPGTRFGVWVQGCTLACKGCMSRDTWSAGGGTGVPVDDLVELWRSAVARGADGLTVSGGEPLQQAAGLADLLTAADEVRRRADRELDFLVYTGYDEDELDETRLAAVDLADVVVFGRFDVTKPTALVWRGSANQRMVPRTDLGRRRYADLVDHAPERGPLQVEVRDGDPWIIGTPRQGALRELGRSMKDLGLRVTDTTWRP
ncbi:4Fe-4S single cluster domain-containing protein [Actinokineospora globicatena]|uniref:4Fe-4S single cluster domain-containing protein n=1 Tax=Actinokineospora globicatena TaxID=103729 RepID=UPI0020A2E658|nr:4Fe-4S single cluster domain-containing protein [Actinokineospora globicatena]MCP2302882.1 anaerobic ribonucleoside-triphosphate reductase activating protein [Actinokineospora globicatena]GLW78735.1 radical activating enzyme [Actinokineospora globicatena]GLW84597.1 radical activating enzyme [Actinokineospora globicatena]